MTIADQLREQGKLIGIEIDLENGKMEGKIEEREDMARNLVSYGFDIPFIMKVTKLSEKDVLKLKRETSIKH